MITINKFESKYKSFAEFTGTDITKLFESVRCEKHCAKTPSHWLPELTLSIEGFYNGKSVYVSLESHTNELRELISSVSVYGDPQYKDVYLKVANYQGKYCLVLQYQQIIGSYRLFDITSEQRDQLIKLFEA